ncbi:MAG: hypothetical protein WAM14_04715 [Candidatus Nitrosopolaris sp.]
MTTIELNSSNDSRRIRTCKEKQQHIQHYGVAIKYISTTGPIQGIEEAIRKLVYWKGGVLDLEIFQGCIEPIVSSSTSDVGKQTYSIHMKPRNGLCQARGCNSQYDIETKLHRSSNKEDKINPDLFLCKYHFNKNRNDIRGLKTKRRLSLVW